jgi:IclR family pca regulon transcriptional regulator
MESTMTPTRKTILPHSGPRETDGLSKSLIKGLAILSAFSSSRPVLGIAELADRLQMSRSTTHRYACTLVALGYLEQDSRRRYQLGLRAADLGMSAIAALDLRSRALPYLRDLRQRSSGTVSLAVLDGAQIICLDRLPGSRNAALHTVTPYGEGSRLPVHACAAGKLLAALLGPAEQDRLLAQARLDRLTPKTLTSKKALRAQLNEIRQTRLALEDEELLTGMRSLAGAIYSRDGEALAAVELSMPAPTCSVAALRASWSGPLQDTARRISALAGAPPAPERARPPRTRRRAR